MDSFDLRVQTTFTQSRVQLVLNLVPASMCLVKRMNDCQAVYLVVSLTDSFVRFGSAMHEERKFSKLL
jgi:hypothetical protein